MLGLSRKTRVELKKILRTTDMGSLKVLLKQPSQRDVKQSIKDLQELNRLLLQSLKHYGEAICDEIVRVLGVEEFEFLARLIESNTEILEKYLEGKILLNNYDKHSVRVARLRKILQGPISDKTVMTNILQNLLMLLSTLSRDVVLKEAQKELEKMEQFKESDLEKVLVQNTHLLSKNGELHEYVIVGRQIRANPINGNRCIDLLLLDRSGVLTIIEVKIIHSMDVLRRGLGQLMDYAARVVNYWSTELIRQEIEKNNSNIALKQWFSAEIDEKDFWKKVQYNLTNQKIRCIIASPKIQEEFCLVIRFLSKQMSQMEFVAAEILQKAGEGTSYESRLIS